MLPIGNPEKVTTVVNRYGYIYNVKQGSLQLHDGYVTFLARGRGFKDFSKVSVLHEEIGTVVEVEL